MIFVCAAASASTLPDLVVNREKLARTVSFERRTFNDTDCAVIEECVPFTGERRLLLFDAGVINLGTSLTIGNPATHTDLFMFSNCHGHYHMRGFATYALLDSAGSVVRRVRKGFCLRDDKRYLPAAQPEPSFTCDNQGLSAGWQDIYDRALDCQFLDITGVSHGEYRLRITINPLHLLLESNYANNQAEVPIWVPRPTKTPAPVWIPRQHGFQDLHMIGHGTHTIPFPPTPPIPGLDGTNNPAPPGLPLPPR